MAWIYIWLASSFRHVSLFLKFSQEDHKSLSCGRGLQTWTHSSPILITSPVEKKKKKKKNSDKHSTSIPLDSLNFANASNWTIRNHVFRFHCFILCRNASIILSCYQTTWDMVYRSAKIQYCTSCKPAVKNFLHITCPLWSLRGMVISCLSIRERRASSKNQICYPIYMTFVSDYEFLFALAAREVGDKFATHHHSNIWKCGILMLTFTIWNTYIHSVHL